MLAPVRCMPSTISDRRMFAGMTNAALWTAVRYDRWRERIHRARIPTWPVHTPA